MDDVEVAMKQMGLHDLEQDPPGNCDCEASCVASEGLMICPVCSVICARILDASPEWRSNERERCGAAASPFEGIKGMGTIMRGSAKCSAIMKKVVNRQGWGHGNHKTRELCAAFTEITSRCHDQSLSSNVILAAKHIYNDVSCSVHMRCTPRAGLVEGSLYAAMLSQGNGRSIDELSSKLHMPKTVVTTGARRVMNHLKTTLPSSKSASISSAYAMRHMHLLTPAEPLGFADAITWLIDTVESLSIVSKCKPPAICSACAEIVSKSLFGGGLDRVAICEAFECAPSTAVRCLSMMKPYSKMLIEKLQQRFVNG